MPNGWPKLRGAGREGTAGLGPKLEAPQNASPPAIVILRYTEGSLEICGRSFGVPQDDNDVGPVSLNSKSG